MCVYKSRRAPRDLAHEPTPKKSGEFEERFVLGIVSVASDRVTRGDECVWMHAAELESPAMLSYVISLYVEKPAV